MKISSRKITLISCVAAIYAVLTILLGDLSYAGIQIRISEALMILCLLRKEYCLSLTLGCVIANLFSPLPLDILFGSLATAIAGILMYLLGNNGRNEKLYIAIIASLFPVITNAFIVSAELYFFMSYPFWVSVLQISVGEFISCAILGNILLFSIRKNKAFYRTLMFIK